VSLHLSFSPYVCTFFSAAECPHRFWGSPSIPIQYLHGPICRNAVHRDDFTLLNTVLLTYTCFYQLSGYVNDQLICLSKYAWYRRRQRSPLTCYNPDKHLLVNCRDTERFNFLMSVRPSACIRATPTRQVLLSSLFADTLRLGKN